MPADAKHRSRRAFGLSLLAAPATLFLASRGWSQNPTRAVRLGYLDSGWASPESQALLESLTGEIAPEAAIPPLLPR